MKVAIFLISALALAIPSLSLASTDPESGTSAVVTEKDYSFPPNLIPKSEQGSGSDKPLPLNEGRSAARIQQDYPIEALKAGQQGSVGVEAMISSSGSVIDCSVFKSSGYRILDDAACNGLRRYGRFAPAQNAQGEKVESIYRTTITFRLH